MDLLGLFDDDEPKTDDKGITFEVEIKDDEEEVEEHMVTHIPFRDWCAYCVKGKRKSQPHRQAVRKK